MLKSRTPLFLFLILFILACEPTIDMSQWKDIPQNAFVKKQLTFPRVRDAFQRAEQSVKTLLLRQGITSFEIDLYFRAFKQEQVLEVWAKAKESNQYQLIETYPFCTNSGILGPKRKEGDRQIPEGFYRISHYNPKSQFLLSLKVNYPNAADKILSDPVNPGGDIYIHGGCQTVGCIPITNTKIQEVYLLAVMAKTEGASTPIHIFPFKMHAQEVRRNAKQLPELESFWNQLKPGFDFFEKHKTLAKVKVSESGAYEI